MNDSLEFAEKMEYSRYYTEAEMTEMFGGGWLEEWRALARTPTRRQVKTFDSQGVERFSLRTLSINYGGGE